MPDTIHLVFKTHLDIGFTDYAANVVRKYHMQFIPQAIRLAAQTRASAAHFRWTVGAWLIYDYLEQASSDDRRRMEQAIEVGDIVWHALPFTTHTELMDESLFRFGLSYSQRLDARFGRTTIAGKMTDVPGHTRLVVPLLDAAGIRLLHLGVNPVAAVPDVPPVFVWHDCESDARVCVVYEPTYGGVTRVDGLDDVLAVILTGDNEGPPAPEDIAGQYAALQARYPGARVTASTLDDFAAELWAVRDTLPVVTSEIGDTWIHGVGTDPAKVSRYRALSRLRREWLTRELSDTERRAIDTFSGHLIKIPEHTWGMDEKTHLPDTTHYTRDQLAALRREPRTQAFERSWEEQREIVAAALGALAGTALQDEAYEVLNETISPGRPQGESPTGLSPVLKSDVCTVLIDARTAAVIGWTDAVTGTEYADPAHPLAALSYTVYGSEDYERYWLQYIRNGDMPEHVAWARADNTKIGMPTVNSRTWSPVVTGLQWNATSCRIDLAFPDEARGYGAPAQVSLDYYLHGDSLAIFVAWQGKPANRIAEAFWLSFNPANVDPLAWRFEKMGGWIDPQDVVSRGARTLHAVDRFVVCADQFSLETLDAPLVAPGKPSLLDFHNQLPDMRGGVHVCLYNNVWGTNFPMWYEDDALFRFTLRLKS